MIRSRTRALFFYALAAASLAISAAAQSGSDHPELDPILTDNNLAAATAFLNDADAQAGLKTSDPNIYAMTFARATELLDIGNLIGGDPVPAVYRKGLMIRTGCAFCQSPSGLLSWAADNFNPLDPARDAALRKALLEWGSLDPEPRDWLTAQGQNSSAWASADLNARYAALKPWIDAQAAAIANANPADDDALAALKARFQSLNDYLDNDQGGTLWTRFQSAESAVKGLDSVRQRVAASGDARLQGLLAQAQSAGTLESRLALLSQLFDGLGEPNADVNAAAPPRAGQVFDADSRRTVADLLKTSLLREIAGTWTGDTLIDFYSKTPLDLRVGPTNDNDIALYKTAGPIIFNESYIQRFLKAHGKDIRDLQQDPALLGALTVELSSVFVHESTHKRQYQWSQDSGVNEVGVQNLEMEANETESLYVVEKSKNDPSYLAQMKQDAKSPGLAQQALSKARALTQGGGDYYRDFIDDIYMDVPSLEGDAWLTIKANNGNAGTVPQDYVACRDRLAWQSGLIDQHLNALLKPGAAGNAHAATEVPPPPQ